MTAADPATNGSTLKAFVSYWPSLPFMAYGVLLGWSLLIYSGATWLSESEINGSSLNNLYMFSTAPSAVVFLAAALLAKQDKLGHISNNRYVFVGGVLAAVGSLAIVLAGPYYAAALFGPNFPILARRILFRTAAVVAGAGFGLVSLRCGMLYGQLSPRRTLIYLALSHFLGIFIYMITLTCPEWKPIEYGPSITSTVVLIALPLIAAAMAKIEPSETSGIVVRPETSHAETHRLPRQFWSLMISVFALSFAASAMRANVLESHALDIIVTGNSMCIVLLAVFAFLIMLFAVSPSANVYTLGKTCSVLAVVAATVTACVAAFGNITNELSVVVYVCRHLFDSLTWCILAFIAVQRRVGPAIVFGIGRGLFLLGCVLGWITGTVLLPLVPPGNLMTALFLALAAAIMSATLWGFARNGYDQLFSAASEGEPSMEDLFDIELRAAQIEAMEHQGKRGRFTQTVEALAEKYRLSAREAEAFRYLAMGYGNDRIAESMQCKGNTARTHTRNVYQKLDVHNREQLMRLVDDELGVSE